MTSTRPRIARVGSGKMGSLHARVLAQTPLCDLALLVEPREEHGREDAAQAHGATFDGEGAGSFGLGCFSFYAT